MCRLLIKAGANVRAERSDRDTPLHLCARNNKLDAARLLLQEGASASAADKFGTQASCGRKAQCRAVLTRQYSKLYFRV